MADKHSDNSFDIASYTYPDIGRDSSAPPEQKKATFSLRVECYAGYQAEERPLRFHIGQRLVEITEVIDQWLAPDHRYFKVRGSDEGIYILRYDAKIDQWELILFDQGASFKTRLSST